MFGLAIWDDRKKELIIARDRLGIKPLFYGENNGQFSFASEIKAISDEIPFKYSSPSLIPFLASVVTKSKFP